VGGGGEKKKTSEWEREEFLLISERDHKCVSRRTGIIRGAYSPDKGGREGGNENIKKRKEGRGEERKSSLSRIKDVLGSVFSLKKYSR